jgi:hypothetical protein
VHAGEGEDPGVVVGHEIGYRLWPFIVQLFDLRLTGTATGLRWISRTSHMAAV